MRRFTTGVRRYAAAVITLALTFTFLLCAPHAPSTGKSVSASNGASLTDPFVVSGNDKKFKLIRGEDLRVRVEQLRSKNKGLARAIKEYEKRGRVPRWNESISILKMPEKTASNSLSALMRPAAYTQDYTDGDSEIDFITYSGDLDSWDGIAYFHASSMDGTYSGTVLTPSDDTTTWDVTNELYYPPDGGDPQCGPARDCLMSDANPRHKTEGRQRATALSHHKALTPKPSLFGFLKRWWGCTTNNCAWGSFWLCSGWSRFFCEIGVCTYSAFWCIFHS